MHSTSRYRAILCLGIILLVHLLIIAALLAGRSMQRQGGAEKISDVWLIPEIKPQHKIAHLQKAAAPISTRSNPITVSRSAQQATHSAEPIAATNPEPEVHLDLDALRAEAVQQEIGRKKTSVELMNESREKNRSFEAKVEEGVNKAQRSDCRNAYASTGLFAPLLIGADLIRDKGCKF